MTQIQALIPLMEQHFAGQNPDHGMPHILRVFEHATAAATNMRADRAEIVRIAALLHDADDKKLFTPDPQVPYKWARHYMRIAGVPEHTQDVVVLCIKLVSCSEQANNAQLTYEPWMLIPRDADRLDAIGVRGYERCVQYNAGKGRPWACPETPIPANREELLSHATVERFAEYQSGVRTSPSVLDHCYDKLLHLTCNDSNNAYFAARSHDAKEELIAIVLAELAA